MKNKRKKKKKSGQASKGAITNNKTIKNRILLALFLALLFLVALKIINQPRPDKMLEKDAEKLLNAITNNQLRILDSDQIDEKAVEDVMRKDYEELKSELGLKSDFCIFFQDENGKLVKIDGMKAGIGSEKVKVNGVSCG